MQIDPEKLYVPKEVAQHLRCSLTTVYTMVNSGELAHYRIEKRALRILGADLVAFVESCKVTAPADPHPIEIKSPALRKALGL